MTKQSEVGIGQLYFVDYNYKLVHYLHYMYDQPSLMLTGKLREISSYDTISYPFDIYTWGFTYGLIAVQFVLLLVIQNIWSSATGKSNPKDYIYEGDIKNISRGRI